MASALAAVAVAKSEQEYSPIIRKLFTVIDQAKSIDLKSCKRLRVIETQLKIGKHKLAFSKFKDRVERNIDASGNLRDKVLESGLYQSNALRRSESKISRTKSIADVADFVSAGKVRAKSYLKRSTNSYKLKKVDNSGDQKPAADAIKAEPLAVSEVFKPEKIKQRAIPIRPQTASVEAKVDPKPMKRVYKPVNRPQAALVNRKSPIEVALEQPTIQAAPITPKSGKTGKIPSVSQLSERSPPPKSDKSITPKPVEELKSSINEDRPQQDSITGSVPGSGKVKLSRPNSAKPPIKPQSPKPSISEIAKTPEANARVNPQNQPPESPKPQLQSPSSEDAISNVKVFSSNNGIQSAYLKLMSTSIGNLDELEEHIKHTGDKIAKSNKSNLVHKVPDRYEMKQQESMKPAIKTDFNKPSADVGLQKRDTEETPGNAKQNVLPRSTKKQNLDVSEEQNMPDITVNESVVDKDAKEEDKMEEVELQPDDGNEEVLQPEEDNMMIDNDDVALNQDDPEEQTGPLEVKEIAEAGNQDDLDEVKLLQNAINNLQEEKVEGTESRPVVQMESPDSDDNSKESKPLYRSSKFKSLSPINAGTPGITTFEVMVNRAAPLPPMLESSVLIEQAKFSKPQPKKNLNTPPLISSDQPSPPLPNLDSNIVSKPLASVDISPSQDASLKVIYSDSRSTLPLVNDSRQIIDKSQDSPQIPPEKTVVAGLHPKVPLSPSDIKPRPATQASQIPIVANLANENTSSVPQKIIQPLEPLKEHKPETVTENVNAIVPGDDLGKDSSRKASPAVTSKKIGAESQLPDDNGKLISPQTVPDHKSNVALTLPNEPIVEKIVEVRAPRDGTLLSDPKKIEIVQDKQNVSENYKRTTKEDTIKHQEKPSTNLSDQTEGQKPQKTEPTTYLGAAQQPNQPPVVRPEQSAESNNLTSRLTDNPYRLNNDFNSIEVSQANPLPLISDVNLKIEKNSLAATKQDKYSDNIGQSSQQITRRPTNLQISPKNERGMDDDSRRQMPSVFESLENMFLEGKHLPSVQEELAEFAESNDAFPESIDKRVHLTHANMADSEVVEQMSTKQISQLYGRSQPEAMRDHQRSLPHFGGVAGNFDQSAMLPLSFGPINYSLGKTDSHTQSTDPRNMNYPSNRLTMAQEERLIPQSLPPVLQRLTSPKSFSEVSPLILQSTEKPDLLHNRNNVEDHTFRKKDTVGGMDTLDETVVAEESDDSVLEDGTEWMDPAAKTMPAYSYSQEEVDRSVHSGHSRLQENSISKQSSNKAFRIVHSRATEGHASRQVAHTPISSLIDLNRKQIVKDETPMIVPRPPLDPITFRGSRSSYNSVTSTQKSFVSRTHLGRRVEQPVRLAPVETPMPVVARNSQPLVTKQPTSLSLDDLEEEIKYLRLGRVLSFTSASTHAKRAEYRAFLASCKESPSGVTRVEDFVDQLIALQDPETALQMAVDFGDYLKLMAVLPKLKGMVDKISKYTMKRVVGLIKEELVEKKTVNRTMLGFVERGYAEVEAKTLFSRVSDY